MVYVLSWFLDLDVSLVCLSLDSAAGRQLQLMARKRRHLVFDGLKCRRGRRVPPDSQSSRKSWKKRRKKELSLCCLPSSRPGSRELPASAAPTWRTRTSRDLQLLYVMIVQYALLGWRKTTDCAFKLRLQLASTRGGGMANRFTDKDMLLTCVMD